MDMGARIGFWKRALDKYDRVAEGLGKKSQNET